MIKQMNTLQKLLSILTVIILTVTIEIIIIIIFVSAFGLTIGYITGKYLL